MKNRFLYAVAGLLALSLQACTIVNSGNVGVERSLGKVSLDELGQGQYVTVFDSVDEVTTKEVSVSLQNLTPKSMDNLTMAEVDIDIYYKTNPQKVADLYIKYQGDVVAHEDLVQGGTSDLVVASGRVVREARESAYTAVSKFNASTMHTKRAELSEEVRATLQAALEKSDPGAFTITSINVRNVKPDPAIERAIQNQIKLDQDILKKEKEIILAQKEAERLLVQTEGQAAANNKLNSSLTGQLVQLQLAEIRRQTVVGAAGRGNTIIVDAEAVPLISK